MLVLSRHVDEAIVIDAGGGRLIRIMPVAMQGDKVRIGIDAPRDITVHREEIWQQIQSQQTSPASPAA